jgi:hypothetical protein
MAVASVAAHFGDALLVDGMLPVLAAARSAAPR